MTEYRTWALLRGLVREDYSRIFQINYGCFFLLMKLFFMTFPASGDAIKRQVLPAFPACLMI